MSAELQLLLQPVSKAEEGAVGNVLEHAGRGEKCDPPPVPESQKISIINQHTSSLTHMGEKTHIPPEKSHIPPEKSDNEHF